MARNFATNIQDIINSDVIKYFYLIKLELKNSNFYFTSHGQQIYWNNINWLSDGGLFEVESPKFSSVVDREAYKIILSDLDNNLANEFKSSVIGRPIEVWVGLLDSDDQPLLGSNEVMPIYKGFIDSPAIDLNWESKTAIIEGTSPMADLDQVNLFMVSRDGMKNKNSNDTSFDAIYEDSENIVNWGKI